MIELEKLAAGVTLGEIKPPDPRWDEWYRRTVLDPDAILMLIRALERLHDAAGVVFVQDEGLDYLIPARREARRALERTGWSP